MDLLIKTIEIILIFNIIFAVLMVRVFLKK